MSEKITNTFEKAKNYNTWEGRPFQIGYERKQYLEKIVQVLFKVPALSQLELGEIVKKEFIKIIRDPDLSQATDFSEIFQI